MAKINIAASLTLTDQQAQWASENTVTPPSNSLIASGYKPATVVPSDPENWINQLLTSLAMQLQCFGFPVYNNTTIAYTDSGGDYCYIQGAIFSSLSNTSVLKWVVLQPIPTGMSFADATSQTGSVVYAKQLGYLTGSGSPIATIMQTLSPLSESNYAGTGVSVFGGCPGNNIYALLNGQIIPKAYFPTFYNIIQAAPPTYFTVNANEIVLPDYYQSIDIGRALINAGTPVFGGSGQVSNGTVGQFVLPEIQGSLQGAAVQVSIVNGGVISLNTGGQGNGSNGVSFQSGTNGNFEFSIPNTSITTESTTVNSGLQNLSSGVKVFWGICIGQVGE